MKLILSRSWLLMFSGIAWLLQGKVHHVSIAFAGVIAAHCASAVQGMNTQVCAFAARISCLPMLAKSTVTDAVISFVHVVHDLIQKM